ncbi:hypothetical protein J0X15_11685 [Roseibium sp. CAU 1637]|uniref:Uncharacterized protein n=1 Tax=Roseibium limicola TaxID=2816037 RepID=A0A939EP03_9HYPH|nr:hypothetical protein [Roseibium limicola]MBO0345883.1 hypothetical protein [Roseibium limicola]
MELDIVRPLDLVPLLNAAASFTAGVALVAFAMISSYFNQREYLKNHPSNSEIENFLSGEVEIPERIADFNRSAAAWWRRLGVGALVLSFIAFCIGSGLVIQSFREILSID